MNLNCSAPILWASILILFTSLCPGSERYLLLDGSEMVGEKISEDSASVLIQTDPVNGVSGQMRLPRASIKKIVAIPADEDAFRKLPPLDINSLFSGKPDSYAAPARAAQAFLKKFPTSELAPALRQKLQLWMDEQELVSKGFVKSAGQWYSPDQARDRAYDLKANQAYADFQKALQNQFLDNAWESFLNLETQYPLSISYGLAGSQVRPVLEGKIRNLAIKSDNLSKKLLENNNTRAQYADRLGKAQGRLGSVAPDAAASIKNQISAMQGNIAEIDAENSRISRQVADFKALSESLQAHMTRLAAIPFEQINRSARSLTQLESRLAEGQIEEVRAELAKGDYKKFALAQSLQKRIDSHDHIVARIREDLTNREFAAAADKAMAALKEFPNSDSLLSLRQSAESGRRADNTK
ncbi:MAG: hypothetical protein SFY92_10495 [Verrucomicrobiae bacterium]|nr:hypothetical protein [Verrucomicrobiae bacterium]